MKIKQFRYSSDNMAYLVYSGSHAMAIDPGATDDMISFAEDSGLTIDKVVNTHSHYDHIMGNSSMLEKTKAEFIDCKTIGHDSVILIGGKDLKVFRTPGHIDDCVTFYTGKALITGDTLFNGTVGTCFSGDMKSFLDSILFLMSFPPETLIYAGHDYVKESVAFAKTIDKDNEEIERYLAKYNPSHVVSTLADEFKANPFLRFNTPEMTAVMKQRGLPVETELDRWNSIMELY